MLQEQHQHLQHRGDLRDSAGAHLREHPGGHWVQYRQWDCLYGTPPISELSVNRITNDISVKTKIRTKKCDGKQGKDQSGRSSRPPPTVSTSLTCTWAVCTGSSSWSTRRPGDDRLVRPAGRVSNIEENADQPEKEADETEKKDEEKKEEVKKTVKPKKPTLHTKVWDEDKVYLYQSPRTPQIPSIFPPVVEAEIMAETPWNCL